MFEPTEPLVPNAETIDAMKAARRGELVEVDSADALLSRSISFHFMEHGFLFRLLDKTRDAPIDSALHDAELGSSMSGDWFRRQRDVSA